MRGVGRLGLIIAVIDHLAAVRILYCCTNSPGFSTLYPEGHDKEPTSQKENLVCVFFMISKQQNTVGLKKKTNPIQISVTKLIFLI
jgi:hypothetical protein